MVQGKLPDINERGTIKFDQKISEMCNDLIKYILNPCVSERPTAREILKHPWFLDTPDQLDIFDE